MVQPLWLNWTKRPGGFPDWPEPGPVSFPAADAGKHPPTRRVAVPPPDPTDRPSPSAARWWPLQPPGASSDSHRDHVGQTLQTGSPGGTWAQSAEGVEVDQLALDRGWNSDRDFAGSAGDLQNLVVPFY